MSTLCWEEKYYHWRRKNLRGKDVLMLLNILPVEADLWHCIVDFRKLFKCFVITLRRLVHFLNINRLKSKILDLSIWCLYVYMSICLYVYMSICLCLCLDYFHKENFRRFSFEIHKGANTTLICRKYYYLYNKTRHSYICCL